MESAIMKRALQVIFGISVFGMCFSGTLTYRELITKTALSCPAPGPSGTILGYPACVYGLLMYTVIAAVAAVALWSNRRARIAALHPAGISP
jgi:uncharacterized membrane protein